MTYATNMTSNATMTPADTLCTMLTYRRKANSKAEAAFIARFIVPLGAKPDSFGNYILRIGDAPILYSSHTDSVHRSGGRQKLAIDGDMITVGSKESNCLGADDATGVWIMREMILANKPGLYIFHRQEESGGLGSHYIATRTPKLLAGIKYAIAFDRRGFRDVITHQAGGRCASDTFANALAKQLGNRYASSSHGIFTDTANYTDLIGECTNISVGYENEHRKTESLNLRHALLVRSAMLAIDVSRLPCERKPGAIDPDGWSFMFDDADQKPLRSNSFASMTRLIRDNPDEVADILLDHGIGADELADLLYERGGIIYRNR